MSVNSKMTAIADQVRTLQGIAGTLGLDAMASNLASANGQVTDQTALIAQLIEAAEGKAGLTGGARIVMGTYTPAATQTARVVITHDLGVEPTGVLFAKRHTGNNSGDTVLFNWETGEVAIRAFYYNGSFALSQVSVDGANTQVHADNPANTDVVCALNPTTFKTPAQLHAGEHIWFVWG